MKFYTKQRQYTCGIDLHARSFYVCMADDSGRTVVHKQIKASPDALSKLIAPYPTDLVIGLKGMFSWYWVADDALGTEVYDFFLPRRLSISVVFSSNSGNVAAVNRSSGVWNKGLSPAIDRLIVMIDQLV